MWWWALLEGKKKPVSQLSSYRKRNYFIGEQIEHVWILWLHLNQQKMLQFKVVRYVTRSFFKNRQCFKLFIYYSSKICKPFESRVKKRQCDVIMTSWAPKWDHPRNDVFDRFFRDMSVENCPIFSIKQACRRKMYSAFNGCYFINKVSFIMIRQTIY